MKDHEIESLHQQASSFYLQGNTEAALDTWRQILEHHPDEERALEGVELCERVQGAESVSVVTEGESPFAVGTGVYGDPDPELDPQIDECFDAEPAPQPGEGLKEALDELRDLTPDTPAAGSAPTPKSGFGSLDLSDLDEATGAIQFGRLDAVEAPVPTAAETEIPMRSRRLRHQRRMRRHGDSVQGWSKTRTR